MKTIGVDVGGTFTDLVYCNLETGELAIHKVATTPDDPSRGVMQGVGEICAQNGVDPSEIAHVFHGTTTATNAALEGKGAVAGMITNDGFRDIIHIGRHQRPQHYSIQQDIPWQARPLVKRRFRKTVGGRLAPPSGQELEPLDEAGVRQAAEELKAEGVEAVAICFLFSYLNPAHELRAKEIVEEVMPDAFVTTSALVSPQFREFERFTTASLAAFVGPKVKKYIADLGDALTTLGVKGELRIMASNGGASTPAMVSEKPALTLLSGLAAGVLGGGWIGAQCGRDRLITFDIGGTSADIGIVVDGQVAEADARSTEIAGFPLLQPMLDIHTIGAGGGSIAHVDRGGAFRVGPQSAGAVPGPACYGHGGTEPTVTDANLVLGRLEPEDFLGGAMALDAEAAERAVAGFAETMGLSLHEAAEGILTIVNANMANAIRSRTVQKGIDPRGFALVAMGGAGPLSGAEVAKMLSIPEVLVPPYPGITSAMGLLTTDLKYDAIRTQFQVSTGFDADRLGRDLDAMFEDLTERFDADDVPAESRAFQRLGDLRYVGQGYELRVPLGDGPVDEAMLAQFWADFHAAHAREYGHAFTDSPIELVNIRLVGTASLPKLERLSAPEGGSLEAALVRRKPSVFRTDAGLETFDTPVYRRVKLPVGTPFDGPAILLQTDSTTVVPPGAEAEIHTSGSILIRLKDISGETE
ncbi:hydantoinase/oxoprolinase family protein [Marinibacterium profundimaris]|uniref:N-methylhydantoinase n=1 Tax=Marinibacterium profundimaris TaxID=1679460 RepID=A0A225NRW3_9RHOB|nr:hydantoinase/oxoprolinase family protein [Marinibacterium profundimaris]OWU77684.1 N-methylhydantoinase [Marinibacterium profundimaris]